MLHNIALYKFNIAVVNIMAVKSNLPSETFKPNLTFLRLFVSDRHRHEQSGKKTHEYTSLMLILHTYVLI